MDLQEMTRLQCPVCDFHDCQSAFSFESYELLQCPRCRLIFIPEEYFSGHDLRSQYINDEVSASRYYLQTERADVSHFSHVLKRIEKLLKPGRLLDVGCGVGHALSAAQSRGWKAVGIEPNPVSAEIARKKGFTVKTGFFEDLAGEFLPESFDAVLLGDILEHIPQPVSFLKKIHTLLSPQGVLAVVTINMDNFLCRKYQVKPKEHFAYFNASSLSHCLVKSGFEVKTCSPYARERNLASMFHSSTRLGPLEKSFVAGLKALPSLNFVAGKSLKMVAKDELLAIGRKI